MSTAPEAPHTVEYCVADRHNLTAICFLMIDGFHNECFEPFQSRPTCMSVLTSFPKGAARKVWPEPHHPVGQWVQCTWASLALRHSSRTLHCSAGAIGWKSMKLPAAAMVEGTLKNNCNLSIFGHKHGEGKADTIFIPSIRSSKCRTNG